MMIDWYEHGDANYWRETAARCEKLADAAGRDGDRSHEAIHRWEAAERRERARKIEVQQP